MYTIKQVPIPKYYENNAVKAVVLHVDLGTAQGTVNHLRHVASASYHVYFPREKQYENEIWVFVPHEKGAWHAGKKSNPTPRAQQIFGNESVNVQSAGWCYGGRPVDANGRVNFDWSRVVDGEKATESQVKRAVWFAHHVGYENLPFLAHREITSYKPPCVLDFKDRVLNGIAKTGECTLDQFTTNELISELLRRFRGNA